MVRAGLSGCSSRTVGSPADIRFATVLESFCEFTVCKEGLRWCVDFEYARSRCILYLLLDGPKFHKVLHSTVVVTTRPDERIDLETCFHPVSQRFGQVRALVTGGEYNP